MTAVSKPPGFSIGCVTGVGRFWFDEWAAHEPPMGTFHLLDEVFKVES